MTSSNAPTSTSTQPNAADETASPSNIRFGNEPPLVITSPPGPRSIALSERLSAVECPAFDARRNARSRESGADQSPIVYASARGSNVTDADGNRYVDLVAGFGSLILGHSHPRILSAWNDQSARLGLALGDVYSAEVKVELTERLASLLPEAGARVMLGLSGADAVTAAMKSAVLSTGKPGVVAFSGSYHGLSHGPLAACGLSDAFRKPFAGQTGDHVRFAPYPGSAASLDASLSVVRTHLLAGAAGAVLVEPILGRGGCVVPPPRFLHELRTLCNETGVVLIADEVWTGMGRGGAMLATVAAGVLPDLVCIGKGLGAGLPISACIGRGALMEAWGAHGGGALHTATHFGAPPSCAVALESLALLQSQRLAVRSCEVGGAWMDQLSTLEGSRGVEAVRGAGMMVGVQLEGGAGRALAVCRALLARGYIVLTGGVRGDVITLTPPLNIETDLLLGFVQALDDVLAEGA